MKFKKFSLALLFFVINFIILFTFLSPEKHHLQVGERAKEDIKATKDVINKIETEKKVKQASEEVQPVYRINPTVQAEVKSDIENFFDEVYETKDRQDLNINEKIKYIKEENINISDKSINTAFNMDKVKVENLKGYIFETINQIMSSGVTNEELNSQKKTISEFFEEINKLNENEKLLGIEIINNSIRPNKFLDLEKTQEKIEKAKLSVSEVIIPKGENIISKGEVISKEKLELLQGLSVVEKNGIQDFFVLLGITLIILILEGIGIFYITAYNPNILKEEKKLLLIILILSTMIIVCVFLSIISPYIIPITGASMLISILLNSQLSIVLNLIISILIYFVIGDVNLLIVSLISGTFASFTNLEINQRKNIILTGFKIGIINFIMVLALGFMTSTNIKQIFINSILSFLSSIISSILVLGTLPFWEHYFDILTSLKLLELSSPNNEVLKRMLIETPGTYHHSIIVGNLAERACYKIGANSLLARVSSYYHDIGKLVRPYFFKENQITSENPHDKIIPNLSSKIIKDHVFEGVELAKKYKIPKEIINIIREHHGTTLVAYFYYKAKEEGLDIKEEEFRYEGPRPQSKEAAVVMLADSVEAGVRSIKEPTKEKIEEMINKIVSGKLSDGQLDKSNITLTDLDTIKETFLEVIMGMLHQRIEYPEIGGNQNGTTNR